MRRMIRKYLLLILLVAPVKYLYCGKVSKPDESYQALKQLHDELDNDHDGKVNEVESADFMKEKKIIDSENKQRHMFDDDEDHQISIDELWKKWIGSSVYRWSIEEVVYWLKYTVELPDYARVFRKHKVNGKLIPRLATPQDSYLHKELKVTNQQHRRKIYLKASDLILYGVPTDFKTLQSDKSFLAIKAVHTHLDDDNDGIIDAGESQEYLDEELEVASSAKRHMALHTNDDQISVDELWESWQESEVYRWTTDQVIDWLKNIVGLPQYEKRFREKKINGKCIPRIATDKSAFLQTELGVKNPKHRRKIYLRASDIILFGAPEASSHFNDKLVAIIVIIATLLCGYTIREKRISQMEVEKMSKDLIALQQAEDNLKTIQETLVEAQLKQQSNEVGNIEREKQLLEEIETAKKEAERLHKERDKSQEEKMKLNLVEQELSEVRLALAKAEIEMKSHRVNAPQALQQWLQKTYRLESQFFQLQKNLAMTQMSEAKDACEKVSRARRSMFGSLRLAHGQTIDVVDQKILNARGALAEVTNMLQERQHRWLEIENLCHFSIVNDGLFSNMPKKPRKTSLQQALADVTSLALSSPMVQAIEEEEEEDYDLRSTDKTRTISIVSGSENCFDSVASSNSSRQQSIISSQSSVQDNISLNGQEHRNQSDHSTSSPNLSQSQASNPALSIHRSESERLENQRAPEKKIHRVNTEPFGLAKKHVSKLMNGEHSIDSNMSNQSQLNNKFAVSSNDNLKMTSSSHSLEACSEGDNLSESGNHSDDSTFSSASVTSAKKKKSKKPITLSKIFHRKQKVDR